MAGDRFIPVAFAFALFALGWPSALVAQTPDAPDMQTSAGVDWFSQNYRTGQVVDRDSFHTRVSAQGYGQFFVGNQAMVPDILERIAVASLGAPGSPSLAEVYRANVRLVTMYVNPESGDWFVVRGNQAYDYNGTLSVRSDSYEILAYGDQGQALSGVRVGREMTTVFRGRVFNDGSPTDQFLSLNNSVVNDSRWGMVITDRSLDNGYAIIDRGGHYRLLATIQTAE